MSASRESNPSSIPQGYIDIYTLVHMGGCNRCGEDTVECYHNIRWLAGLWSTQNQVECTMLKAAEHCSSITSVVNNCLGETGPNPLYGLLSKQNSINCEHYVFPVSWENSLTPDADRYE